MLDCKVAKLTFETILARPRYWTRATIEKWLADQGFIVGNEKMYPIGKSRNDIEGCFYFVQNQYKGVSR